MQSIKISKPYSFTMFCALFSIFVFLSSETFASKHDSLTLNGLASFSELNSEIYIGGLFLESEQATEPLIKSAKGYKRMDIRIKALEWRERSFSKTWNRTILINNTDAQKKLLSKEIIAFTNILKGPLTQGDQLLIDYTPQQGTVVSLNGFELLKVEHEDFFNIIVNCWIGNVPPSTQFKNSILKSNKNDANTATLIRRFEYLAPPEQLDARRQQIAKWPGAKPLLAKTETTTQNKDPKSPLNQYIIALTKETQRRSPYPDEALLKELSGEVILSITLNKSGKLLNSTIAKEDKFAPFNVTAINGAKISKYPPFPSSILAEEQSFSITIKFAPPRGTTSRIGN